MTFCGIIDINARQIVKIAPSVARAFSAILRALISIIPNKRHINDIIIHLLTNNNRVRDFKLLLLTKKRVNHRRALSCNNALRSRVNGLQIDVKGIIMSDKVDI